MRRRGPHRPPDPTESGQSGDRSSQTGMLNLSVQEREERRVGVGKRSGRTSEKKKHFLTSVHSWGIFKTSKRQDVWIVVRAEVKEGASLFYVKGKNYCPNYVRLVVQCPWVAVEFSANLSL